MLALRFTTWAMTRFVLVVGCAVLLACGRTASAGVGATGKASAHWSESTSVRGIVDLTSPRTDGTIVAAARGGLTGIDPRNGSTQLFAPQYSAPPGLEPYITLAGPGLSSHGCSFSEGTLYALRLRGGDGVTAVSPSGAVRRFASLPSAGLEDGITLDTTPRFGPRLLVTSTNRGVGTVYSIDCRGHVRTLTASAPWLEGGIVVAPAGFGRFGGDLIAPDEHNGGIYAVAPDGTTTPLATSGLPRGQDIGVESLGFVPAGYHHAFVADRHTPGNRHPGDDRILELTRGALTATGVRPGQLLAVSEGGARTIAVSCASVCTVRQVAGGPPQAHIEGHVVFN
ncbi:MAG: hypothetical protein ACYDHH_14250 [Solirubrobacteraceae bacterium]